MNDFKTVQLENGNIFAYYPKGSEITILDNGDYFCTTNNNLCFTRPSHTYMIKKLRPRGKNITVEKYYNNSLHSN